MKQWRRWCCIMTAVMICMAALPCGRMTAYAGDAKVYTDKISQGKTGKSMNVSFTVKNTSGHDIEDLGVAFDITGGEIWDEEDVYKRQVEAVNRALAGEDYSQGALYFMNRRRSKSSNVSWFDSRLDYLFYYEGHEFFK